MLAIALGVLAMHGLASGHHGSVPALPSLAAATAAVEQHAAGGAHAAEHSGYQAPAVGAVSASPLHDVLAGGCDGDCGEHPSGLLLLCAAVLLAAAGATVLGLGRCAWRAVPSTGPPERARASTSAPLRRLDLVADLCISRT